MPEMQTPVVKGQEPEPTPPQVDPANTSNGQEPREPKPTTTTQTYSEEYVKDLRKEAATYRTKVNDVQKQLDTVLTELNGIKLKQKANKVKEAFSKAAVEAGAIYPDPVYALVTESDLKVNEAGEPDAEALKSVITNLQKTYPALFKPVKPAKPGKIDAGSGGNNTPPTADFNTWIRQSMGIQ